MSSTFNQKIFFDGSNFYELKENKLNKILLNLKNNNLDKYSLIIDDNCFFYELLDIPFSNKKKMQNIIKHYLMVHYPEEFLNDLKYIEFADKILVLIPSQKLYENDLFSDLSKFKKFTTPFLEALFKEKNFNYKAGEIFIIVNNNDLHYSNEPDKNLKTLTSENILSNLDSLKAGVNLAEDKSFYDYTHKYLLFIIIILISYAFFTGGELLRIKSVQKDVDIFKNALNTMYLRAGITDKKDPYGLLLYKVKSKTGNKKVKIYEIILKLTQSADNLTLDSFNYQPGSFYLKGTTKDFAMLEKFKTSLENTFDSKVYVTDTQKKDDKVDFSMRVEL